MSMATTVSHSSTLPSRGYFATINSGNITERIHELLTERECSIFDKGLAAYHKRKDVTSFVEALSLVLNTNPKRQLLVPIRDIYIKPSDMIKFNSLAIKYGIALPMRGITKIAKKGHGRSESGPKVIELKRNVNQEWGFSIRGGSEHGSGIFISWVDSGSNAEKAGLRIGDYVHRVNEHSMDGLTHAQATQVFKHRNKISLVITSYGKIPGFQFANKSYRWVDSEGKPATPPTEMESIGMIAGGHVDPTIKKVSFNVEPGKELGVSIRGGAEHGLAIYVSAVDKGSVADLNGIKLGDQILEVNSISYINILHPDAAKGLKQQRQMTMKLKEIGKLPQAKIVPGQWQPPPSLPPEQTPPSVISQISQPRSLPGTTRRGPAPERNAEVIATAPMTSAKNNIVMLKKTTSPARGIMNDTAQSLLSKPEMSTFTYYITRYEHNQIGVEELVQCLLKLFNTSEKMHLLSEVRNIVRPQDLDIFNELTIRKEIIARKNRTSSLSSSDGEGATNRIVNGRHPPQSIEERDNDSLDEIPQRMSPIQVHLVPTFHAPPPPARRPPTTSTPEQQQIIAQAMRDRRLDLHESVLEEDGWEDTLPRSVPAQLPANMVDEATLQRKLQEAEEKTKQAVEAKLKQEFEQQQQQMLEAKLQEEKAAIEAKFQQEQQQMLEAKLQEEKAAIEQEKAKLLEDQKRQFSEEREALEKKLHELQEQSEPIDKNKLEEEIWRQAEDSLRQELTDEIRKESENKMKKDFERKLETSLAEERRKTEAEKRKREEFEKEQRAKDVSKQEEEEQQRIEAEQKIRQEAEELARQEYEARLQRESEEKARLAEEIKSYRTIKDKMESERKQREKLEKAKKEAEEKALKEAKEKARLEALLKEKEEELAKKEQEKEIAAMQFQTVPYQREESDNEEEELRRQEEEELRRQEEEEEELRRQEEEELRRQEEEELRRQEEEELRRQEEELKRQEELKKKEEKARKDDEKRRRQEEKEKARRAEQERLKRLREEEEKRAREEEERREQEELEQQREEDNRLKKEEKRVSKEGSFFDPALMDDLVMDVGGVGPPPSSNSRPGHVSFQDQRTQQQKIIENERKMAEQMLANRLRQKKEAATGLSYGGYTGLKGTIDKVNVTKVNRKLGIAVDGGANTKQKAVIIRQIVPDGSAALTGKGLLVGQQILAVNGKTLKGLKHKEAVLAIKNAFDGPMQKVIEFVLLNPE